MEFRKLLFVISLMVVPFMLFPRDYKGLDFKIKFFNQSIYRVDSNVSIEVSLSNLSDDLLTLEVGDINTFGFDFDVTDTTNIKVKRSLEYVKDRSKNVAIPVRTLSLRPNERFSVMMSLNQFVQFDKDGVYFVRGKFFPDISDSQKCIESNVITLFLKPKMDDVAEKFNFSNLSSNREVQSVLKRENLSPDKVIEYLFSALRLGEREKFFLYIDIESLILNDQNKSYLYKQELRSGSNSMLEEYKEYLWNNSNSDIAKVPNKFSIVETTYTDSTGKVVSDVYFEDGHFYVAKRYTFFFKKYDYYWIIYDYTVQNTGIKEKY
ncbi:hypothetical protein [Borrelia hermsii]|uniref:Uncharacterized protein n=3 Tax=Borrelia hermsii TaxID=140 RepID=A0AAN0X532_BORHE|nr:hypothetical protein [Borrelia hermsii]AAX17126.1 hypothetical protein BH0624 [Borrelia hermsii DAH]AJW73412.1 hypothetical protein L283_03135 [Borrelia hermsii CC1]AMR75233.1 hypothetical protein A0V01_01180 [Borrelia hermsii]ANA43424.1 hypothetical protein AXX13_03140 [Borrelia hermsii HS1]UCP01628.1 hypothetical protein K9R62_03175 [Borrelia hermsii]